MKIRENTTTAAVIATTYTPRRKRRKRFKPSKDPIITTMEAVIQELKRYNVG